MTYDILVRGGRVVDPTHGRDEIADLAIVDGRVVAVGPDLDGAAEQVIEVAGSLVLPGLVDLHVHIASHVAPGAAHAMLARAGVTTALDLSGTAASVVEEGARSGVGLQVAVVEQVKPDVHMPRNPTRPQIRAAFDKILAAGGIGVKLHVDKGWDADATGAIIDEANRHGVWVASHCGTTTAGSDIEGLRQTLELAGDNHIQIAHVNSYCRGDIETADQEAQIAVELLRASPHVFAESYLAEINGTSGVCADGVPTNKRVIGWLERGGYDGTEAGLRRAIHEGFASVPRLTSDDMILEVGDAGVEIWEAAGTRTGICLPINPGISRLMLGASRNADGRFDVHAFATDGGGIPRNVTLEMGLSMVDWGLLDLRDLVTKACRVPALVLGLPAKGHLGIGADADLAVVDRRSRKPSTVIAGGRVVLRDGVAVGTGTRFVHTSHGSEHVERVAGLGTVIDPVGTGFYTGEGIAA
ncbi:amidohydrolase family protein [Kribbella sp. GL6]|uniref:amidohydrolase family protein n=1 Tax=Kribbella sp. GL6 TaxID=3419765 RepID=UPI003CFCD5F1